ncbi:MAG TPA: alpha/beta hydrolase-fold protein [Thermoanaerobaculia bacterium]|nr:alpha/beta hydrolase-fold protein [Thermoanaerobaculia bacterium]
MTTGFLHRSLTIGATEYRYCVYLPREFDPSRRWPVILFLHGSGERGTDGMRPTMIGLASAIRSDPDRVPAIVVFPQAPPDSRWLDEPAEVAMRTLDEFRDVADRVFLTGLSMGGYGAWHLALAHRHRFAKLVVVCGGLLPHPNTTAVWRSPLTMNADDPYVFTAHALRHIPIWMFHGADDPIIPVSESRQMFDALQRDGADVRYTEYAGVGHNSWERAYNEPELWRWLFSVAP